VKAGAFTAGRKDTQLALLGNGQVLAAGDEHTCGVESGPSDSAELWHPRKSHWTKTDRMPSARTMTTLVALADGRAMVMGGANREYVAKSSTAVYDPEAHGWSVSGLLHTARMEFAASPLAGGGVLVAGGLLITRSQGGRALRSAETWDPRTGRWSEIAPLASVRMGAAAVTLEDGRVLVVGGFPSWGADRPLETAEIYDPATGRWRDAGSLTAPRTAFTLVPLRGGGALVVGGQSGEDQAEVFDPVQRSWSRVRDDAPAGERPAAAALRDGRILVVSGRDARIYDPRTGRWTRTARLPGGMWDASAVSLPDGSVLVGGGWTKAAPEGDTPGCPTYSSRTWRFIPGT
jgi:N-acetylneuraminic acid mutarotase